MILARRVPLRLSTEARAEAIEILAQSPQQRPRGPGGHAGSVRDATKEYKRYLSSHAGQTELNLTM